MKSRSSVMIVTRRLNDEQDSHCMVRGNRLPVLTARMQDCEEMTYVLHFQCLLALCLYRHGSFSSSKFAVLFRCLHLTPSVAMT